MVVPYLHPVFMEVTDLWGIQLGSETLHVSKKDGDARGWVFAWGK